MNIWIIRNGEKEGPLTDYEIREKIESGELNASTPAWHETLDAWITLGDIQLFNHSLHPNATPAGPTGKETPARDTDDSSQNPHLLRRFWARWLDLYLFSGIWWLSMWVTGRNIEQLLIQPWIMLLHYAPWFAIEALLISRYATTPGKWLLNLKVLNLDGSQLSLQASIIRSARVLLMGIGFGLTGLCLLCQAFGWFSAKRLGRPLWDRAGGHFLDGPPVSQFRITGYVIALLFSIWLQTIVLTPYIIETMEKNFPKQAELMKDNPPWHLPKRSNPDSSDGR